ncbi:MAG: VWA domain-containing protein [Planctomycetota bacterium]|nr:VWA domain-containing protein [Planctomycetota bacterium]
MNFLSPQLAALAAAIAVPTLVILYFLKLRRRDVEVSTTLLWKKSIQDLQANAPFQKLRKNILLFLQLLALLAALLALGQPFLKGTDLRGRKIVILIDRSASMSVRDESEGAGTREPVTRLEEARRQALKLVESMKEPTLTAQLMREPQRGDEAMVIAFDSTAEVRQRFTSDKAELRRAIEAITPTDAPTSVNEALRLARAQSPQRVHVDRDGTVKVIEGQTAGEPLTLHLFSDGRLPDADRSLVAPEDTFVYHRVGSPRTANVGITSVRASRSFENPSELTIFVGVQSSAREPREVEIELVDEQGAKGLKRATVGAATVQAEATQEGAAPADPNAKPAQKLTPGVGGVVFTLTRAEGMLAEVRLRDAQGLTPEGAEVFAADKRAWAVVPPAKQLAVLLVSPGSLFLRDALEGLPLARFEVIGEAEYRQRVLSGASGRLEEFDVIVLDRVAPPLRSTLTGGASGGAGGGASGADRPSTGLPAGRYLMLGALPGMSEPAGTKLPPLQIVDRGEKKEPSAFIDWRRDHPALRSVSLDPTVIAQPRVVEAASGAVVLARSDVGPAIVEVADEFARAIVVPWNVTESTWPLEIGFPVFVGQAVRYLGGEAASGSGQDRAVTPGATLTTRVPGGVQGVRLEGPPDVVLASRASEPNRVDLQPAADGTVVYGPVPRIGLYAVSWQGPATAMDSRRGDRATRVFAANLSDGAESVVEASEEVSLANQVIRAEEQRADEGDRRLWPWLVLAGLVVVLLEWWVYNRKVRI